MSVTSDPVFSRIVLSKCSGELSSNFSTNSCRISVRYWYAKIRFLSQMAASELSRSHNVKLKAKEYMESDMKEYGSYPTGGASTGPGMGQYRPVADLNASKKVKKKEKGS